MRTSLLSLTILRNSFSLRAFTVYMENLLQFEISLWSNLPNKFDTEMSVIGSHVNTDYEDTFNYLYLL